MGMESFESLVSLYEKEKEAGADGERMIELLLEIGKISYEERLMYELQLWYWKEGYPAKAKRVCRQMRQFFHEGEWVDRAAEALQLIEQDEDIPEELETRWLGAGKQEENTEVEEITPESEVTEPEIVPKRNPASKVIKHEFVPENKPESEVTKPEIVPVQEPAPAETQPSSTDEPEIIREAFKDIIGMDSVRQEMSGFYNIARLEKLREQQLGITGNSSRGYNFVLYGNPGTGKTTVARIIGKLLYALGIRENDKFMEVDRSKLVSEYVGQTAKNVQKAVEEIKGGVLFIDEAYSLYKKDDAKDFGQEAIDTLLKHMEDHRSDYSVILAGYRAQMTDMLDHANPGFRSRFTYHILLPDYSDEELLKIADQIAGSHQYKIDEKGHEALRKRIERERIDETFGNARFIREVINDAEKNLANRLVREKRFDRDALIWLRAEDIYPEGKNEKKLSELLDELNQLTGLSEVKKSISELLDKLAVQKEAERRGITGNFQVGTLHMAFKGNAGTGKTTVARLLGKILAGMNVLKRGDVFIEVTRADLIGQYQGHTAAKVKDVVRSALGGVLFIDEAYALVKDSGDSFGREAVDTLVAEKENHRDALVVILAGYTSEIDRFLGENQGLRSRVTRDIYFEDYSVSEMVDIFCKMAKHDNLILDEGLIPKIQSLLEMESRKKDFGNGRGVRNVYEQICRRKDSRVAALLRRGALLEDKDFVTLKSEDI